MLATAALALLLWQTGKRQRLAEQAQEPPAQEIAVYVNGALHTASPLIPGQDLVIAQEDGSQNVIRMTESGFFMQSSTCKNQDCIHQGSVTRENWSQRLLGTHIICLPNRVDVTLLVTSADPDIPDV